MEKPRIRVVAAYIERDGKCFITQRRPEATLPLLWEFPGGRVEKGETDEAALARELAEEMDARIQVRDLFTWVDHEYDGYVIELRVYRCALLSDEIHYKKVHDARWVTPEELATYEFPDADQETVDQLLKGK